MPSLLTFLAPGLLAPALISVPGQRVEREPLAAAWADLRPPAAVALVDVHLVEAHGQLTELALDGALLAFLGLRGGRRDGHGHWPAVTAVALGI